MRGPICQILYLAIVNLCYTTASSNSAVKIVFPEQVLQHWLHSYNKITSTCDTCLIQLCKHAITSNLESFTSVCILGVGSAVAVNTHAVASFPGLPTVQFLIACSIQKRRGKAWSILSCFVYVGRQREGEGSPIEKTSLMPYVVVSAPSAGVLSIREAKNVPLLFQSKERVHKMHSFNRGSLPPSVYLGRQNVIKWTRPSPSIFAYCKQSKTGRWEGLGTRLLHADVSPPYDTWYLLQTLACKLAFSATPLYNSRKFTFYRLH